MRKLFYSLKTLSVVSFKMYVRDRRSLFFSLIMPLAFLGVFGLLSRAGNSSLKVTVTNYSRAEAAGNFLATLQKIPALQVREAPEPEASAALKKGSIDLQVIVPENFGAIDEGQNRVQPAEVLSYYNQAKPQNGQAANLIIGQVISELNRRLTNTPEIVSLKSSGVTANNLGYFDFILPGILAMTIMQLGLFGMSMAFTALKASGALRRLQATPVHPRNFIFGQTLTRLLIALINMTILVGFGIKFFGFHMNGSFFDFAVLVILGILVFLGFGLAIAGWAKDGNQAAPISSIVQLPMLLLSGVFFSRDIMPAWLQKATGFLPLTYLADGMRRIANEGASLAQVGGSIAGLLVWGVIVYVIAGYIFRWE